MRNATFLSHGFNTGDILSYMTALPLFDSVLLTSTDSDHRTLNDNRVAQMATQMVRSALHALSEIKALDSCLAPGNGESLNKQLAVLLRGMYEEWDRETDALLTRVARLEKLGALVEDSEQLRDAQGRLRAMLSVSLEDIEKGRREIREGRVYTSAEVRRELGLQVK